MTVIKDRPCVLLVNLGSPDRPETKATRRYLRQFLSDRRVIETHPALWLPILEGIILRVRPKDSAAKYATVWGEEHAPLLAGTIAQTKFVRSALGNEAEVRFAMRYGSHSIQDALDQIFEDGCRRLLVVPLYPQYSATTIASVTDEVYRWNLSRRDQFSLRVARSFQTNPAYIDAMAVALENSWEEHGRPNFVEGDRLLLSYHGIPQSMADKGDPYPQECSETTAALTRRLRVPADGVVQTFQSKFGPAPWLEPATIEKVAELGATNLAPTNLAPTRRVDVICPGFVSDCLETLEEINELNRETFLAAGGQEFHYVPWGNDSLPWLEALESLVRSDLAGWL